MALTYGRITGKLLAAVTDTADAGTEPDLVPLVGTVTFTLNVDRLQHIVSPLQTIITTPIVATLHTDGTLTVAGGVGVTLLATDNPDLNPTGGLAYRVTYAVTHAGKAVPVTPHMVAVPGGSELDISLLLPASNAPIVGLPAAEAAAAVAAAAALAAQEAAENGATPEQIETAVETYLAANPPAGATWGAIGGDIEDETALIALLSGKADTTALGTAAYTAATAYATAAQGALADTAVQPGDLGTAAAQPTSAFATAAQGTKADSAVQPAALTSGLAGKADLVGGKVPTAQIPAVALTERLGVVASEAAMLALVGQPGDFAVRSDLPGIGIIHAEPSSVLENWTVLEFGEGSITLINGQSGPTVVLSAADVGARPDTWVPDWTDVTGKPSTFAPTIGATATTAVAGNDTRLTNERVPTANSVTDAKVADAALSMVKINGLLTALGEKVDATSLGTAAAQDASEFVEAVTPGAGLAIVTSAPTGTLSPNTVYVQRSA